MTEYIDLRSDTVTKPTKEMLEFMMSAEVGDDVFGEDVTVQKLEKKLADMLGMEAGLFCPSGTMTNQIAVKVHTQPGEEVICEASSHIFKYEVGGIAFHSGCQAYTLQGHYGKITAEQVLKAIRPEDIHQPKTSLVCLENTANRGGGSCYDWEEILKIKKVCEQNHLKLHLDGARFFNAIVATQQNPVDYGKVFDSISICLSKSLGAPVGSVLLGNKDFIKKARKYRKLFGGGMRQAGYLAAAGIYALDHHIHRLEQDHHHAQIIAEALQKSHFVQSIFPVQTNIIIFEVKPNTSAFEIVYKLKENQILCSPIDEKHIRMVTHLNISEGMVEKIVKTIITLL